MHPHHHLSDNCIAFEGPKTSRVEYRRNERTPHSEEALFEKMAGPRGVVADRLTAHYNPPAGTTLFFHFLWCAVNGNSTELWDSSIDLAPVGGC